MPPIKAHFDGKVFIPDQPVDLPTNKPLVMYVHEIPESADPAGKTVWEVLDELTGSITDAPPDWSAQHDHYLYGTPKRPTPDEPSK